MSPVIAIHCNFWLIIYFEKSNESHFSKFFDCRWNCKRNCSWISKKMKKTSKTIMIALTSQNFHQWLRELKDITKKINVWKYVDSKNQQLQFKSIRFFETFDYQMSVMPQSLIMKKRKISLLFIIRSTNDFEKLLKAQQKTFQMRIIIYQIKKKIMKKMTHDMKIINNALKTLTHIYIFTTNMNVFIRNIIKALINKYQRSNAQITQQIFEHFRSLQKISLNKK